jgi:hypothetical protein
MKNVYESAIQKAVERIKPRCRIRLTLDDNIKMLPRNI